MGFIMAFVEFMKNLMGANTEEGRRKKALKPLVSRLASINPPFYRSQSKMVLPGFPQTLLAYCRALAPIQDITFRTIANGDQNVSRRFMDLIVDLRLSQEDRNAKRFFTYEGMNERVSASLEPDKEIKAVEEEFRMFLVTISPSGLQNAEDDLLAMDRLAEICRHDYERLLGIFDPGVNLENQKYRPDFNASDSDQIAPELIDIYYILHNFIFSERVWAGLVFLMARISQTGADQEEQKKRLGKLLATLNALLMGPLHPDNVLALLRVLKQNSLFIPDIVRAKRNYLEEYRIRVESQFNKDRDRVMRERHENIMTLSVKDLYGDEEILTLDGYNEETNSHLQAETANSFTMIQPLRLIKTFVFGKFDPLLKGPVKRLLVEGYFDNKVFQNNLTNVFYQCERASERIHAFEESITSNGRQTVGAIRRFIEESKRGKDVSPFLPKVVDSLNLRARELVENETTMFNVLAEIFYAILQDFKRSAPELVTNIRTIGIQRNREILNGLTNAYNDIQKLVKVMKCFPQIRIGVASGSIPEVAPKEKTEPLNADESPA